MTLMTLGSTTQLNPARITFDGLDLGSVDADGIALVCNGIAGWHDAAPRRTNFVDRDNADGQHDAPVYRSGRVITLSGWAYAPSRNAVASKINQLKGRLGGGRRGTLTIDDPDLGRLSTTVRWSDGPQIDWNQSAQRWMWQFQVTAPDPNLYGDEIVQATGLPTAGGGLIWPLFAPDGVLDFGTPGTDGRVTIANPGTADTWPTFVIAGQMLGGFTLTDVGTGRFIQYAGDVPAGSTLTIRSTGRADINGADRTANLVVAQWWPIPPSGSSTVQLTAPAAAGQTGSLTMSARPAYE